MTTEHKCTLKSNAIKSVLPPLHPAGKCFQKFLRKLTLLLMLNEKDFRSKVFFNSTSAVRSEYKRHARSPYWFMIHPFSKLSVFIERLFLVLFIERWLMFVTMYYRRKWIRIIHYVRDFFHGLIMISFFITGYVNPLTKDVYIYPKESARHYLSGYFFIDLYMILEDNVDPIIDALVVCLQKHFSWAPKTKLVFVIPLACLSIIFYIIRLRSLFNVIEQTVVSLGFGKVATFVFVHFTIFIFVLHFYSFHLYHVTWQIYFVDKHVPEDSWIVLRNISVKEYNINTYTEGFLIVLSYFLGSDYADDINQPYEKLILFIFSFTGRFYVLVIISKVLVYFGFGDTGESQYESVFLQLDSYMKSMDVPAHLEAQIIERFKFHYQKKYFNAQELMKTLTDQLKMELFLFGAKRLIAQNGFLKKLDTHELGLLFAHMEAETYAKQEIIEGGLRQRTCTYFILSGSVSAFGEDGLELFHLQDGDEFGFINLSICFVAIETSEVYSLEKKWLTRIMHDRPDLNKYFDQIYVERTEKIKLAYKYKNRGGERVVDIMRRGTMLERRRIKCPSLDL